MLLFEFLLALDLLVLTTGEELSIDSVSCCIDLMLNVPPGGHVRRKYDPPAELLLRKLRWTNTRESRAGRALELLGELGQGGSSVLLS